MEKVIIAGSGPAGLTAAIYAGRAGLSPLVVEGFMPGGQLTKAEKIENYPGFANGVEAAELIAQMRAQAEHLGARFVMDEVARVEQGSSPKHPHTVHLAMGDPVETQTLVIASGASAKELGLESEKKLLGRGVSTCAVCDGAFFKNQDVAVIGGGDTAVGDALYLANICKSVTLIHRRDELRACNMLTERVAKNPKITVAWDSVVEEILGVEEKAVRGLRLKNVKSGETRELAVTGVFVAIGYTPASAWISDLVDVDKDGYVLTKDAATTVPGIFAAGDVQNRDIKQIVTACASGAVASYAVEQYLEMYDEAEGAVG